MIRKLTPILVLSLFLGAAAPLAAADIRFELGFGWTLVKPAMNATYANRYQPTLTPPDRYIASSAQQTVRLKAKTIYGMNGFFNVLFKERFGLQVLADYHRPGLGGAGTDYSASMQFQSFSQPEVLSVAVDGLDSKGNLTQTTFSLNALARFPVADNLSLSASAGPSVFHFEGQAGYVDYTFFDIALVDSQYRVTGATYHMIVDFGPQTKVGWNAGIEAAYEASSHIILAVDLRWFGAQKTDLQMHVVDDPLYTHNTVEEIEAAIGLGTLSVNPSYMRAGLALRFVF